MRSRAVFFGKHAPVAIVSVLIALVVVRCSAQFMTELPIQGCANEVRTLQARDVFATINGSRIGFHAPESAGGAFDFDSAVYFQWTDVREQERQDTLCATLRNPIVATQLMKDCQCSFTQINTAEAGVHTSGWSLKFFQCPFPQQHLVAHANLTFSNVTTVKTYNNTMPGSRAPSFDYTSPYV